MNLRSDRRQALLDQVGGHLLRQGLAGSSLRQLAAAAGTSDRMLLYYFTDKDELLGAALVHVAARLAGSLDALGGAARSYAALLADLRAAIRSPALQPFMRLWLELAACASRGQEPHRAIAGQIANGFLAWMSSRLDVGDDIERARQAALLLATVEGLVVLDAVGRGELADRAAGLAT